MDNDIEANNEFNYVKQSPQDFRMGFIRKVYGVLSVQLAFTVIFSYFAATTAFAEWQMENIWALWTAIVFSIVFCLMICCVRSLSRQVPINYILLAGFTFCETYLVSYLVTAYTLAGYGDLVITAAALTVVMTVALTIYAWTTKTDFTMMGGFLFCCSIGLSIFGLLLIFTSIKFLWVLYTVIALILYGTYLV